MCSGYLATKSSRHASCCVGSLNNSRITVKHETAANDNNVKCPKFISAICNCIKSDLGDLMESFKCASCINNQYYYEVVYLFRFSSILFFFAWLQVYIEKEIHDENFSVISTCNDNLLLKLRSQVDLKTSTALSLSQKKSTVVSQP